MPTYSVLSTFDRLAQNTHVSSKCEQGPKIREKHSLTVPFCSLQLRLCCHHMALLRRYPHPGSSLRTTRSFSSLRYQTTARPSSQVNFFYPWWCCRFGEWDCFLILGKANAEGCYGSHLLASLSACPRQWASSMLCQSQERRGRWGWWLKDLLASAGLSVFNSGCTVSIPILHHPHI